MARHNALALVPSTLVVSNLLEEQSSKNLVNFLIESDELVDNSDALLSNGLIKSYVFMIQSFSSFRHARFQG